jgi:YggT family protein
MSFLFAFANILLLILSIIRWVVIVWVIISWLVFFASMTSFRRKNPGAYNILVQLNDICARMAFPFIRPIRRLLRRWDSHTAGIDWSPMVLLLLIYILEMLIAAGAQSLARAILA